MRALAGTVLLLTACTPAAVPDAGIEADVPAPDVIPTDASDRAAIEVLEERTVTVLEVARRVELVRVNRSDGGSTYLAYVHAQVEPAPLVIVNQPYAGIDWTGQEVDARWAAAGDGLRPDVDAPAYDGDDLTAYAAMSVQGAADDGAVWLLNGAAVIEVFGRFYAGGDLLDDARDAAAAYTFAASRDTELDLTRIGSYGGSWGGMMALFGAALSIEAHPVSMSVLAPPSDFVDLYAHTDVELPTVFPAPSQVTEFFSPYWRRAAPAIGRPPSLSDPRAQAFTPAGLCDALPDDVLVEHDDWDLLIPVRQTEALTAACGGKVTPLYWRRGAIPYATTPLDHGPFNAEPVYPSVMTFSSLHLLHALLDETAPRLTLGHGPALEVFLTLVRDARTGGEDVSWALPRLREVADARVQLFDPSTEVFTPGAEVLAPAVNAVFGTSFDAEGLRAQLASGLP